MPHALLVHPIKAQRDTLAYGLYPLGYGVTVVAIPREAYPLIDRRSEPYNLILIQDDYGRADTEDGPTFARTIRRDHPQVPIIACAPPSDTPKLWAAFTGDPNFHSIPMLRHPQFGALECYWDDDAILKFIRENLA